MFRRHCQVRWSRSRSKHEGFDGQVRPRLPDAPRVPKCLGEAEIEYDDRRRVGRPSFRFRGNPSTVGNEKAARVAFQLGEVGLEGGTLEGRQLRLDSVGRRPFSSSAQRPIPRSFVGPTLPEMRALWNSLDCHQNAIGISFFTDLTRNKPPAPWMNKP